MILDSIESVELDESRQADVERLERDIESLQRTVDNLDRQTASMSGRGGGGYRRYKRTSQQRQRASQGELLADYKTKLRQKQGELKRLERELNEPKQLIYGHWEGTLYTLETTRDMSRSLDRISRGDTLTWDGRRLRADGTSAEWVVTRVAAVDPPSTR
jgi:predicted RNase H-like nuclease (RuvC/YqgF family)